MLPERLLTFAVADGRIVPEFLGPTDEPWLSRLLEVYAALDRRPRRELASRLERPPEGVPAGRWRMAVHVLDRHARSRCEAAVPPRRARAVLFAKAASAMTRGRICRAEVVGAAALALRVEPAELEAALFADLPGERLVVGPPDDLSPRELALRTNRALVQGLLYRASAVRIELEGNARAVVRHARLRGLICTVPDRQGAPGPTRLDVSGPFALFRRTLVYGRALGELLGHLAWCDRFRLEADCILHGYARRLHLRTGDPIFPSAGPKRFDSRLERQFAREFARRTADWKLVREPEPVRAGRSLIFPDFAIVHERVPSRRWYLEIVGFWTEGYLVRKLAGLREAGVANLIVAVDADRNCGEGDLPPGAALLPFRGRVEASAVLALIEERSSPAPAR